jgi:plasmid maintenance system antidote protein VapI
MMTGDEYEKAIEMLGLTQVAAARFLGVDDTTSRRWIADKHPIPDSTAMLLRVMIRYRLTPKSVTALMKKELV